MSMSKSSLSVKGKTVFYWVIGTLIVAVIIAASFYFDEAVRQFMLAHQNSTTRSVMTNVSRFGDWPEHVLVGLVLVALAQWRGSIEWKRVLLAMLIALAIAGLTGRVLKISTGRARPGVKSEQMWTGPHLTGAKYHSFPSGHVDASMGFFGVLFLARRRLGLACLPIPILIGFSRLYLGAHYLSDVVCAAVLGIICALIVWRIASRKIENRQSKI
jgi:membrane-associated phospholipid phosphatase